MKVALCIIVTMKRRAPIFMPSLAPIFGADSGANFGENPFQAVCWPFPGPSTSSAAAFRPVYSGIRSIQTTQEILIAPPLVAPEYRAGFQIVLDDSCGRNKTQASRETPAHGKYQDSSLGRLSRNQNAHKAVRRNHDCMLAALLRPCAFRLPAPASLRTLPEP